MDKIKEFIDKFVETKTIRRNLIESIKEVSYAGHRWGQAFEITQGFMESLYDYGILSITESEDRYEIQVTRDRFQQLISEKEFAGTVEVEEFMGWNHYRFVIDDFEVIVATKELIEIKKTSA